MTHALRVLGAAAGLVLLAGCTDTASPDPSPTGVPTSPGASLPPADSPSTAPSVAAEPLEVSCGSDFVLSVSAPTVVASSAGVLLLVSSEAPAGAYLNYGVGGDELPAEPAQWAIDASPGELVLNCSSSEVEGETVTVQVEDPNGYWSTSTMADAGCEMGAIPGWAIGGASGETAEEAVAALAAVFNETGSDPELTRWARGSMGYPNAAVQNWILGTDAETKIAADVFATEEGFQAQPDYFCVSVPWPED
ncbi:hypothetical protein [Demequina sp.]|uniref:hypothetical protein n=1 Tax=Demequina sp. TaxID=2050685 RepID=UPI003D134A86